MVQNDLIQPLQHELIPNIENMWPVFWQDPGPYYDQQWRYSVPYDLHVGGRVPRSRERRELAAQGWDALWNHDYAGEISLYDSVGHDRRRHPPERQPRREHGRSRPHHGRQGCDPSNDRRERGEATINGVRQLPAGDFTVAEAWSGDIVGAQWYLPKDVKWDVLGTGVRTPERA